MDELELLEVVLVAFQVAPNSVDDRCATIAPAPAPTEPTFPVATTSPTPPAPSGPGPGPGAGSAAAPLIPATRTPSPTTPPSSAPTTASPTTGPGPLTTTPQQLTVLPPTSVPPTSAPSTTTPPPIAPGPTLTAVTPADVTDGPAGVALDVSGRGYGTCDTVYFFFDNLRIGSAIPDAGGAVERGALSVPGQARIGSHTVTSSCERTGRQALTSSTFEVTASKVHRPALMTSLPQPRDITLDPPRMALSAAVALGFIILIAFPFQLFNSTLEENYDEVRGWFGLVPRPPDYEPKHHLWLLPVFVLSAGLVCAALSRDFGLNQTTVVTSVGMSMAILMTGLGFAIPTVVYMRRRFFDRGRLRILPGSILIAVVTVGISRLAGFETPGYVYGLLGVFVFHHTLDAKSQGRLTSAMSAFVLTFTLAAWLARVPVSSIAAEPDPALWALILELLLGGIFLLGLESLVVDLFPLRYLDGSRITVWRRVMWAGLFGVALFVLVHVLLSPGSGYVGETDNVGLLPVVIGLFVAFGLFSFAFWGYFRYRRDEAPAVP